MARPLEQRRIVMNFSTPPGLEDLHAVVISVLEAMPDELASFCDDMDLVIEDFPSREMLDEADVESEFDLLAIYRSRSEKIPGVTTGGAEEARSLILFRRPVLDLWCDTEEDLVTLVRNVIVSEVAQANGFSDEEIEVLCAAAGAMAEY